MNEQEKAYLAGIIDGEGSIMLTKFHNNQFPAPCITVASTSLELLYWIKDTTSMGSINSKKNYKPNKHQNSFAYIVKYNAAIKLLAEIEPYLIIPQKKLRAQLILNEYKGITPRNGRYSDEMKQAKEDFHNKFMSIT